MEATVWGGDEAHEHEWTGIMRQDERYTGKKKWQHLANGRGEFQDGVAAELGRDGEGKRLTVRDVDPNAWGHPKVEDTSTCVCGAWRGALGLEPTPELYVEHMVAVFREVRRVLRKDATLWLNIGDSYASSWGAQGRQGETGEMADRSVVVSRLSKSQVAAAPKTRGGRGIRTTQPDSKSASNPGSFVDGPNRYPVENLKPKDLVGIPWMLAFALRADGWWLRQDIIWSKPNPMPESVTDRCTKAHEYVFLLSKSERYYYDADAIREERQGETHSRGSKRNPPIDNAGIGHAGWVASMKRDDEIVNRNKRSVWTIPTAPFPEAHFATYPPALVEPCILAGCPEGGTVLDPFLGSGTTAMVARRLGRRAIGIDLKAEYLEMAKKRCAQMGLMVEPSPISGQLSGDGEAAS